MAKAKQCDEALTKTQKIKLKLEFGRSVVYLNATISMASIQ